MQIEEVIAIAKTLNPELLDITYFSSGPPSMTWLIQYRDKHFYGETIEETLRSAGWKEKTPQSIDNYTDCGRPKGSPYEGQD